MTRAERLSRLRQKLAAIRDELHVYMKPCPGAELAPGAIVLIIIGGPRHGGYTKAEAQEMGLWPPAEEAPRSAPRSARGVDPDVEPAGVYRSPRRPPR